MKLKGLSVTVLAITLVGFSVGLVYAENWELLKSGKGVASLYVDKDSIKPLENGRKAFWLKTVMHYPKEKQVKFQKKEMRLYHSLDCKTKMVYPYTIARGYDGEGTLLDEDKRSLKPKQLEKAKRNILQITAGDKVYAAVCGLPTAAPKPTGEKPASATTEVAPKKP